ncbi:MAG TPA: hypothetical protein VGN88_10885 [Phycisphaerae bacterium]|jgi:hypothetical protein
MHAQIYCEAIARTPPEPAEISVNIAFFLIETLSRRVFLTRYNAAGHLLNQSIHMTVDEAKFQAQEEWPDSLAPWHEFSNEFPSIAVLAQERMRQRYAKSLSGQNLLPYATPPRGGDAWWRRPRGFFGEVVTSMAMIISFFLIAPIAVYIFELRSHGEPPSVWDRLAFVGVFCTVASTLMWRYRLSHAVFGVTGGVTLALVAILTVIGTSCAGISIGKFGFLIPLVTIVTAIPFFFIFKMRMNSIISRPAESEPLRR